jgi:exodeoxyribonuclease VII small subunit
MTDPTPPPDTLGFEAALKALEESVAALESGALDLDASLAAYERGVALLRRCHALLEDAERKVTLLTGVRDDGVPEGEPFGSDA